ncbi:MAG: energy transducer TonB [Rikenellaceae bacterium]|nr:energy transducer TonB [Rikenellaceae bacterium]
MKKFLLALFTVFLSPAFSFVVHAQQPQTIYARGDNQLPEGYTHASFKGADLLNFKVWVAENIKIPKKLRTNEISGRVIVSFIVDETGKITDVEALYSPDEDYSRLVIQTVVSSSGKWKPGADPEGNPVRIRYLLPVELIYNDIIYDGMRDLPQGFSHARFDNRDIKEFREWIVSNIEYPEEYFDNNYGFNQIYVAYLVGKEGYIEEAEFLLSPSDSVSQSILDAMTASAGMWTPASDNKGNPVKMLYYLLFNMTWTTGDVPEDLHLAQFEGGGVTKFRDWVQKRLSYPSEAAELGISGKVLSTFIIDGEGNLTNPEILYSAHRSFTTVVLNILRESPKWKPAIDSDGKPVKVRFVLPVDFQLN